MDNKPKLITTVEAILYVFWLGFIVLSAIPLFLWVIPYVETSDNAQSGILVFLYIITWPLVIVVSRIGYEHLCRMVSNKLWSHNGRTKG